jgi:hypothetical protein
MTGRLGSIRGDDHGRAPLDHIPHGIDHQIRLHGLNVVPALGGDRVLSPKHERHQFVLPSPPNPLLLSREVRLQLGGRVRG